MPVTHRRAKIIHLVSTLNIGGLEMVVWNLARFADRSQFDLRVICLGEPGDLSDRFSEIGVPVEGLRAENCAIRTTVYRLYRRLRELRPDVLHTHNPSPHLIGMIAARLAGVAVLINTKHGRNRTDLPRQIVMNRVLGYFSSCIVPVSEDAALVARKIERVSASRLHVIRNGIDLDSFRRPPETRHPFARKAIHVARLNLIKDQVTLLKAARLVLNADAEFRLDIVGDGPSRNELLACHRELALGDAIRFLGYRQDVHPLLAEADLFVLSSLSEGISMTLLEAMAMQLPVVCTDVGGNPEVVCDGRTGLLTAAQSPEKLADAILALLRDPGRAAEMGRAGRVRVETHFDIRRTVAEYETLYRKLLK